MRKYKNMIVLKTNVERLINIKFGPPEYEQNLISGIMENQVMVLGKRTSIKKPSSIQNVRLRD